MKKHIRWLYGELPGLVKEGVLSEAYAHALQDHYGEVKQRSGRMVALTVCSILGAVLIGAGIILLFGHNWDDLSRPLRTVFAMLPLVVGQALGGWGLVKGKQSVAWSESVSTFITLAIACAIALVGQTYHIPGNLTDFLLVWMMLMLPLIYLFKAVVPCLIYLAATMGWAASAQYDGGHALLFWLLYAAVAPYIWLTFRNDRFSIPSGILGWGLCIHAAWIGLVLERCLPGLWIIIYMGLFSMLYLAGAYWFDDAPSGWQKPMQLVGAGGVIILTMLFTYPWVWHEVGWSHWHYGHRYHLSAVWMDFALAGGVLVAGALLLVASARRRQLWRLTYGSAMIVGVLGFALAVATPDSTLCVLLANAYALLLGVSTLVYGIREERIGTVNGGMMILSVLIVLRFFDEDLPLLVKGVTFICLGVAFLVTNVVLGRRMGREVRS